MKKESILLLSCNTYSVFTLRHILGQKRRPLPKRQRPFVFSFMGTVWTHFRREQWQYITKPTLIVYAKNPRTLVLGIYRFLFFIIPFWISFRIEPECPCYQKNKKAATQRGVAVFVFLLPIAFLGDSFSECTTLAFYRFNVFLLCFFYRFLVILATFSNGRMLLTGEVPGL